MGLELPDGTAILLHCGIDTVNLQGEGFKVLVKEGQKVSKGEVMLQFDKELVEKKGYSSEILMIFTDVPEARTLEFAYTGKTRGEESVAVLS